MKNEFEIKGYPIISILRDNDRHLTYSTKDYNGKDAVVKVGKTIGASRNVYKESVRCRFEKGTNISGPEVIDNDTYLENAFMVTRRYSQSVSEILKSLEQSGDNKKIEGMFSDIVNGTFEISNEKSQSNALNAAIETTRLRAAKYSKTIMTLGMKRCLGFSKKTSSRIPEFSNIQVSRALGKIATYNPDIRYIVENHACLHLDHLFIGDEKSGKYVAIDWEHSEIQPFRYEFLDAAYIFQNLLHRHSETLAIMFYNEFLSRVEKVISEKHMHIRTIFMKKILGGMYEMIIDGLNNPDPKEAFELHTKYLSYFLDSKDITKLR